MSNLTKTEKKALNRAVNKIHINTSQPAMKLSRRTNRQGPVVRSVPNIPRRSRSTGAGTMNRGRSDAFTIHNTEQWYVVTQAASGSDPYLLTHTLCPGASGIPTLDAMAKIFEQYKVGAVRLEYRSSVGTTQGGNHLMAVDYNADIARDIKTIEAIRPNRVGPAWQSENLALHAGLMMKGKTWLRTSTGSALGKAAIGSGSALPDDNAFRLYSKVTGTAITSSTIAATTNYPAIGEVWVTYSVTFRTVIGSGGTFSGSPTDSEIQAALNRARVLGPAIPTTSLSVIDQAGKGISDIPEWLEIAAPIALAALALNDSDDVNSIKQGLNSAYKIAQAAPVSSIFSMAQSVFPNWSTGSAVVSDDIKITFTYPDGSPVPGDVIKEQSLGDEGYLPITIMNGPKVLGANDYKAKQYQIMQALPRDVVGAIKQVVTWNKNTVEMPTLVTPSDIFGVAFEGSNYNVGLGFPSALTAYSYNQFNTFNMISVSSGTITVQPQNVIQNSSSSFDGNFDVPTSRWTFSLDSADAPNDKLADGDYLNCSFGLIDATSFATPALSSSELINCLSPNLQVIPTGFSTTTNVTVCTVVHNVTDFTANTFSFTILPALGSGVPDGTYNLFASFWRYTPRDIVPPPQSVNIAVVFFYMVQDAVQAANTNDLDTVAELLNQYQQLFPTPADEAILNTKLILQYGSVEAAELQNKWILATSLL